MSLMALVPCLVQTILVLPRADFIWLWRPSVMGNALHNFVCAYGVFWVWLVSSGSRHFVVVVVCAGDLSERLCETRFVIGEIVSCGRGIATYSHFSAISIHAIVRERKTRRQAVCFILKLKLFAIFRSVRAGSWVISGQIVKICRRAVPCAVLGACSRTSVLLKSGSEAVMRGTWEIWAA